MWWWGWVVSGEELRIIPSVLAQVHCWGWWCHWPRQGPRRKCTGNPVQRWRAAIRWLAIQIWRGGRRWSGDDELESLHIVLIDEKVQENTCRVESWGWGGRWGKCCQSSGRRMGTGSQCLEALRAEENDWTVVSVHSLHDAVHITKQIYRPLNSPRASWAPGPFPISLVNCERLEAVSRSTKVIVKGWWWPVCSLGVHGVSRCVPRTALNQVQKYAPGERKQTQLPGIWIS